MSVPSPSITHCHLPNTRSPALPDLVYDLVMNNSGAEPHQRSESEDVGRTTKMKTGLILKTTIIGLLTPPSLSLCFEGSKV